MAVIKKTVKMIDGKKAYLLGKDKDGVKHWLIEPSWDCDWYWGFGYVKTYSNNKNPENSRYVLTHTHFNHLFLESNLICFDAFRNLLVKTPLTNKEIWMLLDYMATFYALKKVASVFLYGDSHITNDAKMDILQDAYMWNRINKEMLPELFKKVDGILSPN